MPNTTPDPGHAITVLVVDDSPFDRRIVGSVIEKQRGLRPIFATNGREALDACAIECPAVVVTDLQMPEMDGLELVKAIRAGYPGIPVVLMTAFGSEEIAIAALQAGAVSYVPKKRLAYELAQTLHQVLTTAAVARRRQRLLGCIDRRESDFGLENDPDMVAALIELLQEDLASMAIGDETLRMRVAVALQEALANALYHGNLEVSSDLRQDDERAFYELATERRTQVPYRSRRIHVEARLDRGEATYRIRDEGQGFDTKALDRPIDAEAIMRIGGRGLLLIRTFMDEVTYNEAGNEITMVMRGGARPQP